MESDCCLSSLKMSPSQTLVSYEQLSAGRAPAKADGWQHATGEEQVSPWSRSLTPQTFRTQTCAIPPRSRSVLPVKGALSWAGCSGKVHKAELLKAQAACSKKINGACAGSLRPGAPTLFFLPVSKRKISFCCPCILEYPCPVSWEFSNCAEGRRTSFIWKLWEIRRKTSISFFFLCNARVIKGGSTGGNGRGRLKQHSNTNDVLFACGEESKKSRVALSCELRVHMLEDLVKCYHLFSLYERKPALQTTSGRVVFIILLHERAEKSTTR